MYFFNKKHKLITWMTQCNLDSILYFLILLLQLLIFIYFL